jgi:hypothetical protein
MSRDVKLLRGGAPPHGYPSEPNLPLKAAIEAAAQAYQPSPSKEIRVRTGNKVYVLYYTSLRVKAWYLKRKTHFGSQDGARGTILLGIRGTTVNLSENVDLRVDSYLANAKGTVASTSVYKDVWNNTLIAIKKGSEILNGQLPADLPDDSEINEPDVPEPIYQPFDNAVGAVTYPFRKGLIEPVGDIASAVGNVAGKAASMASNAFKMMTGGSSENDAVHQRPYVVAAGHSLGGALIDQLIYDGLVDKAVSYNPFITKEFYYKPSPKNYRIYNQADKVANPYNIATAPIGYNWRLKDTLANGGRIPLPVEQAEIRHPTRRMQNAPLLGHALKPFLENGGSKNGGSKKRRRSSTRGAGMADLGNLSEDAFGAHAFTASNRAFIEKFGSTKITNVVVRRYPLPDAMQDMIETLTSGEWGKMKRKLPFNDVFHASLIINGKLLMEKNEVLNFTSTVDHYPNTEGIHFKVPPGLTIKEMLEKTEKFMGPSFFTYKPFGNNCQNFIDSVMEANGFYRFAPKNTKEFVLQPVSTIIEAVPSWLQEGIRVLQNVKARSSKEKEASGVDDVHDLGVD